MITKATDIVKGKVALVPYSLIDKMEDCGHIRPDQFGIIIADEVHNLKNPDAKRTEICIPYLKHAKVAIGLSGTPILNRPKEIFTVLSALLPRIFNNYSEFIVRYCDAKKVPYGKGIDDTGASNTSELNTVLEGIIMVRRLKGEVATSLPPKTREIKYILPDPKYLHELRTIKAEMESLKKKMESSIGIDESITAKLKSQQQQQILRYKQVTGLSKVIGVSNIIKDTVRRMKERVARELNAPEPIVVDRSGDVYRHPQEVTDLTGDITANDDYFEKLEDDVIMSDTVVEKNVLLEPVAKYAPVTDIFVADEDDEAICASDEDSDKRSKINAQTRIRLKRACERSSNKASPSIQNFSSKKNAAAHLTKRVLRSAGKNPEKHADLEPSESDGEDLFFIDAPESKKYEKKSRLNKHDTIDSSSGDDDLLLGGRGEDDGEEIKYSQSASEWKRVLGGMGPKGENVRHSKKRKAEDSPISSAKKFGVPTKAPLLLRKNRLPEKIIIFAYHREVMDLLEECLRDLEVDYVRLDGASSNSTRNETVTDFQDRDMADVALLALKACGTGLNLTAASTAIFAELDWSPATMFQAEDRIHRIGQKAPIVKIILTIAENSADDIIWEQLQKKHGIVDATVGASDKGSRISISCHNREATTGQTTLNFASASNSSQAYDSHRSRKEIGPGSPEKRTESTKEAISAKVVQIIEEKSTKDVTQHMCHPPVTSSVYEKVPPPNSKLSSITMATTSTDESNIISLIDEKISEIPDHLIEQQFLLAEATLAKKYDSNQPKGSNCFNVDECQRNGGGKQLSVCISHRAHLQLPQSFDVEYSQFDYPASQVSVGDVSKAGHDIVNTDRKLVPSKDTLDMPALEIKFSAKPYVGWNIRPASTVGDIIKPSAPLQPVRHNLKSNVCNNPLPDMDHSSNMRAPLQHKSYGLPQKKILDDATRKRIEENKKRAEILLQERKNAAACQANAPTAPDRSFFEVSLPEQAPAVINTNPYIFATGKGRPVVVSEESVHNANRLELFTSDRTQLGMSCSKNEPPQSTGVTPFPQQSNGYFRGIPGAPVSDVPHVPVYESKNHRSID